MGLSWGYVPSHNVPVVHGECQGEDTEAVVCVWVEGKSLVDVLIPEDVEQVD